MLKSDAAPETRSDPSNHIGQAQLGNPHKIFLFCLLFFFVLFLLWLTITLLLSNLQHAADWSCWGIGMGLGFDPRLLEIKEVKIWPFHSVVSPSIIENRHMAVKQLTNMSPKELHSYMEIYISKSNNDVVRELNNISIISVLFAILNSCVLIRGVEEAGVYLPKTMQESRLYPSGVVQDTLT